MVANIVGGCYINKEDVTYIKNIVERRNEHMMNQVNLIGRLTKDPDLRYTPNGVAVCTFTLAVNRPWTNEQGERDADFIQHVVFNKTAENVANFVKKGHMVGVEGRLQVRTYENDEGKTVWVTEVVVNQIHFLEKKEDNQNNGYGKRNNNRGGRR